MKVTKTHCERRHSKKRALERYGLELNRKDLEKLVEQIKTGKAEFLERQSNRISKFLVDWQGDKIPVVYDRKRQVIVTFLEKEWISD